MAGYVLGIDQSTQGTKALLFDENGTLLFREDLLHRQIVNDKGWVEHDPEEIYQNVVQVAKNLLGKSGIDKAGIRTLGISNQRETAVAWDRATGRPLSNAIVWQCARASGICEAIKEQDDLIRDCTGLPLSPYFSAAKFAWILQNVDAARECARREELCCGTIDSWLIYKLTKGKVFKTDYSNASRTQLFDIRKLTWNSELCELFGIPMSALAEVCDSDSYFAETDLDGYLKAPIPICGVLGDSHGALFGQGCHEPGMVKATYGTGTSIMLNVGEEYIRSRHGLAASLAWKIGGKVNYVLEGNINYTGAVISWMKDDMHLIASPQEAEEQACRANPADEAVLVPGFTGLSAPWWKDDARAVLAGMSRLTGKAEVIKAGLESIAYQIVDVLQAMTQDYGKSIVELRVDGGATRNGYLMQFQSDLLCAAVCVAENEELSGIGAAYLAGITAGIYDKREIFSRQSFTRFENQMDEKVRVRRLRLWRKAVEMVLNEVP